jgi:hypothetical protein
MSGSVQRYTPRPAGERGATYAVFADGESVAGGTWEGWLEFHPADRSRPVSRPVRETTQPDRLLSFSN